MRVVNSYFDTLETHLIMRKSDKDVIIYKIVPEVRTGVITDNICKTAKTVHNEVVRKGYTEQGYKPIREGSAAKVLKNGLRNWRACKPE